MQNRYGRGSEEDYRPPSRRGHRPGAYGDYYGGGGYENESNYYERVYNDDYAGDRPSEHQRSSENPSYGRSSGMSRNRGPSNVEYRDPYSDVSRNPYRDRDRYASDYQRERHPAETRDSSAFRNGSSRQYGSDFEADYGREYGGEYDRGYGYRGYENDPSRNHGSRHAGYADFNRGDYSRPDFDRYDYGAGRSYDPYERDRGRGFDDGRSRFERWSGEGPRHVAETMRDGVRRIGRNVREYFHRDRGGSR